MISGSSAISECEDVIELSKSVDSNRDEGSFEIVAVLLHQLSSNVHQISRTHPEEHPSGDTGVTEGIPRRIPQSSLLDLALTSPEFSKPE